MTATSEPATILPVRAMTLPMSAGAHSDSRTVNSFLLLGRPLTLVDAGMPFPESLRALEVGLETHGVRLADVEQLVITHAHPDHYAGAPEAMLQRSDWSRAPRSPMADPALSVRVDVSLPNGAMVVTSTAHWQVVHTPGHASTQLCLYEPETGALLSSDHVLPDVTANMVLEPPPDGEPSSHPIL